MYSAEPPKTAIRPQLPLCRSSESSGTNALACLAPSAHGTAAPPSPIGEGDVVDMALAINTCFVYGKVNEFQALVFGCFENDTMLTVGAVSKVVRALLVTISDRHQSGIENQEHVKMSISFSYPINQVRTKGI